MITHDLSDEEKHCPHCKKELPHIGIDTTEEIDIVPAKITVLRHEQHKYGCCTCKKTQEEGGKGVVTAAMPERILPYSIVSPGMLAFVLVSKFCDALPFYRLSKILSRSKVDISRATLCNWALLAGRRCSELLELMWEMVRGSPVLLMDETTLQVLHEPGRSPASKSYMWVTTGYEKDTDKPIILYNYHPTRSKEAADFILTSFSGYLQTDGYKVYDLVSEREGITPVNCFAHARRRFYEADKISKKGGSSRQALSFIQQLYTIEKQLRQKNLPKEEFVKERKELTAPVFQKFKQWLDKRIKEVVPKSALGKALEYNHSRWNKLTAYVEHHLLTPDTNFVERSIRPFVVGRNNWFFSNTPRGAHASATFYSLIETAKANGLEPYRYLRYLFTKLPEAKTKEHLIKLLPMNVTIEQLLSV